ncbi:MAG: glycosyltransferase family 4 protein [Acidimicrobiales bacterium]
MLPAPAVRLDEVAARALDAGLRRVQLLAWRDLDDPEAGGSERHAHHVASLWAGAGLDVTLRTSTAVGHPARVERDGYHVHRAGRRYSVFPRSALAGLAGRGPRPDGLVEIWNGMPFLSPVWARCPRVVFLHHVHAEMWQMVLRPGRARLGELMERRLAPPLYRNTSVVTLSESSRAEIVSMLGLRPGRVRVVPPGIDPVFTPGTARAPEPTVVAVGRLVPVKRFDVLMDALVQVKRHIPGLRAVIVGEGYERARLEAHRRSLGAEGWIDMPGFMDQASLVDIYRSAWVLASTSQREGWGMTISEAGACATPAVVSRIAGHRDAVEDGVSGLVVGGATSARSRARWHHTSDEDGTAPRHGGARPTGSAGPGSDPSALAAGLGAGLRAVLIDGSLRARLGRAARRRALALTWEATAAGALEPLVEEVGARREPLRRG